jgi:hypothetical protein
MLRFPRDDFIIISIREEGRLKRVDLGRAFLEHSWRKIRNSQYAILVEVRLGETEEDFVLRFSLATSDRRSLKGANKLARKVVSSILTCVIMVLVAAVPLAVTGTHDVIKGEGGPRASAVTWEYVPTSYGEWTGHIVNYGLRALTVDLYDVTTGVPDQVMHQRIRFAAYYAYPTGVVDTGSVMMGLGHRYLITVMPNGPKGSSCTVDDFFMPPPPDVLAVITIVSVEDLTVVVDGASSYDPDGTIVSFDWDFGDGTSATGVTATHTYQIVGTYEITLTVTDDYGLTSTDTEQVTVFEQPVASFTYTVDNLTVNVDASTSIGSIVSYVWDWGDGTNGSGVIASHTYSFTSQDASAMATSARGPFLHIFYGYTYSADGVTPMNDCFLIFKNVRTGEFFTYQEESGTNGYVADANQFIESSFQDGDIVNITAISGANIGWAEYAINLANDMDGPWDVILNSTSVDLTVTITLTVTDTQGRTDSTSKTVMWVPWPEASFTVSPAWGYPSTVFTFDASSSSDAETPTSELQVRWDWEDDGIWDTAWSTEKQIGHQFASMGSYVVSLQVMDTDGLISAESKYYYLHVWASGWIPEDVDYFSNYEGAVGPGNSIAVDSNNKVHISYVTGNIGAIKYATNAAGSWTLTTIDSSGTAYDIDGGTSIALDSSDKVHISYYDCLNGDLKYATNVGGSWATYTLDSMGTVGLSSSIAIDSNDKVHISYYDRTSADLKYATNAGGSWACFKVDSKGYVGEHTSIAIDSTNYVHISYFDRTNQHLKYATDGSGSWACFLLDSTGDAGYSDTSIAVDSSNKVHICYYDGTNTALKYATNVDGAWTYSTLDSTYEVRLRCSIVLDSSDNVHISYRSNYCLKYATNAGGSWTCLTLDSMGYWISFNSIAVDSIDKVHISYYCEMGGALLYMHEA